MNFLRRFETAGFIIALTLVLFDAYLGFRAFGPAVLDGLGLAGGGLMRSRATHEYFLDVGQGDSEVIAFPGDIKIMTDAGPSPQVVESFARAFGERDRYIDVAIISHADLDHYGGFQFLLESGYKIGAFVYNGRDSKGEKAWAALRADIQGRNIPMLTLGAGDKIRVGANEIELLSPERNLAASAELNETAFVELVKVNARVDSFRTLLTGDAGFPTEALLQAQGMDLRADILKLGHHGSKYATGADFLRAVAPKIAIIEVGAKNTYGHPSREVLARLASSTNPAIFRTDQGGNIEIYMQGGRFFVHRPGGAGGV